MTRLRIVAGIDVGDDRSPSGEIHPVRTSGREPIEKLLEPVYDLHQRYQQARAEYDRAMVELCTRTKSSPRQLAGKMKAMKRERAARFEPEDWSSLM
jgi:hypothetical protein